MILKATRLLRLVGGSHAVYGVRHLSIRHRMYLYVYMYMYNRYMYMSMCMYVRMYVIWLYSSIQKYMLRPPKPAVEPYVPCQPVFSCVLDTSFFMCSGPPIDCCCCCYYYYYYYYYYFCHLHDMTARKVKRPEYHIGY